MTRLKSTFLDIFRVSEEALRRLISEALSRGGDFADLYFENTTYGNLTLRDSVVASGGSHIDFGAGIRTVKGEKTGYAYSESTALPELINAARAAAAIADAASSPAAGKGCPPPEKSRRVSIPAAGPNHYPELQVWRSVPEIELLPFLEKLETKARSKDPRIVKVLATLSWQVSDIMMFNSFGELTFDTRPLFSVSLTAVFSQGGKTENKSVSRSWRSGVERLTGELAETIATEVVAGIDERFAARRPKGGKMPVVMGAGASGILLHEAMGHAFEADFNRKGQSVFTGKTGLQVCPSNISIIDDGTIEADRGAVNFDDEGVPGQKTWMVREGILTSYLHDRISAAHFGVAPTGNGRRESFRYAPIPRMRSTYMEAGKDSPEDIIASVKKGIYVDEFSNGQVKIGEGDFTFFVKSGFLIENGRLGAPVKDINIIGNGPQALADIVAVGNDLIIDPGAWMCGKEQNVPVSCGIPTVLVKSLTVGGV